jgi:hypothetical protein
MDMRVGSLSVYSHTTPIETMHFAALYPSASSCDIAWFGLKDKASDIAVNALTQQFDSQAPESSARGLVSWYFRFLDPLIDMLLLEVSSG